MFYVLQNLPHTFWRWKSSSKGLLWHMLKVRTVCLIMVKRRFNFFCLAQKSLKSKILNSNFNFGMIWSGSIIAGISYQHNTFKFHFYFATKTPNNSVVIYIVKMPESQGRSLLCWYSANTEQTGNLCPSEVTRQGQDKWNTWIHAEQTEGKLQWDNEVPLSAWQSVIFVYHPNHCLRLNMFLKEKNEAIIDVLNQPTGTSIKRSVWKIRKMRYFYWAIWSKGSKKLMDN